MNICFGNINTVKPQITILRQNDIDCIFFILFTEIQGALININSYLTQLFQL